MSPSRWVPRLGASAVLLAAILVAPAASADTEPFTWRLLNTFVYQGTGWGPNTLNMEGGRANGIFPTGQISITDGQTRMWVASPLSPDPVDFGNGTWTLRFGGNSAISSVEWIPGAYEPETEAFTPAAGTPSVAAGIDHSTFVPTEPFTLPAGANLGVRVVGAFGNGVPSLVDTYDEMLERSPSSLSFDANTGSDDEATRLAEQATGLACANRPTVPAEGCAEAWTARSGGPIEAGSGAALAVAPDGSTVYSAGSVTNRADSDIAVVAHDAGTGGILWQDRFNGPGGPHDIPDEVVVAPGGATVFVTGRVCVTPTTGNLNCTSNYDVVVIAYDAVTGARRWSRNFGGAGQQLPQTVALSPDGSTLVIGGFTSAIAGPVDPQDVYVAALDAATGEIRWEATYAGASQLQDYVQASAFDPAGGAVYVTGATRSEITGYDMLILGFDAATGDRIFERVMDGGAAGDDRAADLAIVADTMYVTGGDVAPGDEDRGAVTFAIDLGEDRELWRVRHDGRWGASDNGSHIGVSDGTVYVGGAEAESSVIIDAFVVAYDAATGDREWDSRFTRPGRSYDFLRDMRLSPDGRRVLLAVESGWFSNNTRDYVTLVHDAATGERLLERVYDGPYRGTEVPNGIASTPDGSRVFVTGASQSAAPTIATVNYDTATVAYDVPGAGSSE